MTGLLETPRLTLRPLAETAALLKAAGEYVLLTDGAPRGAGWFRVADLDDRVIARWLDEARRGGGNGPLSPNTAGSFLGGWLTSGIAGPAAAAYVLDRRVPDLTAGNLRLHRHEEGWFDTLAIAGARIAVLPDDPAAGHPDAEVMADTAALQACMAERMVATLRPLLQRVAAASPFGIRRQWGAVADVLSGHALAAARDSGRDVAGQWHAWHDIQEVVARVAALVPEMKAGPRPFPVTWSAGCTLYQVRGTCCLYFRTPEAAQGPEPERYCTSCPLREDEERHRLWADDRAEQARTDQGLPDADGDAAADADPAPGAAV